MTSCKIGRVTIYRMDGITQRYALQIAKRVPKVPPACPGFISLLTACSTQA